MQTIDPNSPEMGHYVDHWLTELKAQGYPDTDLEYIARGLARAINAYGLQFTHGKDSILDNFMRWVSSV